MGDLTDRVKELEEKMKYSGMFRGVCTENNIDDNDYGVVRVWIPLLMTDRDPSIHQDEIPFVVDNKKGIRAFPANNPLGGRNRKDPTEQSYYQGSVYVPPTGAWLWIFFEHCDPNKARYSTALDIEHVKLLPECRKIEDPAKAWVLYKSHEGRIIDIVDSPDVQRVEITGKKRELGGDDPAGDFGSVYKIDDNQTVLLLDERPGLEKYLIRTYLGDFIHVDIDERQLQIYFEHDIIIKTDKDLHLQVAGSTYAKIGADLHLDIGGNTAINIGGNLDVNVGGNTTVKVGGDLDFHAVGATYYMTDGDYHFKANSLSYHTYADDLHVHCEANTYIKSDETVNIHSISDTFIKSDAELHTKSNSGLYIQGSNVNVIGEDVLLTGDRVNLFGEVLGYVPIPTAMPAEPASDPTDPADASDPSDPTAPAIPIDPIGYRDT